MEEIRRALVISVLSRGWAAGLALLAVPLYLRFLGVESYGVIGIFTSFSILVGFLDLGLGATLTRELARLSAKTSKLAESRDLLRTFEVAYSLIALLIGLLIIFLSGAVAEHWVQAQKLQSSIIAHALALAGVALACQWPTSLYNAGLAGIHKHVQMGIATIALGTFRVTLTLAIVWWAPSLESFFWTQIFSAILQTLCMRWLLWRALKLSDHGPKIRISIIRTSLRFAGGMTGIAITSIILTQADKIILSKALSLSEFGVYVVAGTLAMGLYILITPMFSVFYPRFSTLIHTDNDDRLIDLYRTSAQVMAVLIVPVSLVIAVFSQEILYVWTGDYGLSESGAWILTFLIVGNACNGIMNIPYALQLASGWTKLALWMNVCAIFILVPLIWWAATKFGAVGGAAVGALLNIGYIIITPYIMHRYILLKEKSVWYLYSVLYPFLISAMTLLVLCQIPLGEMSRLSLALIFVMYWLIVIIANLLLLPRMRKEIIRSWQAIV